MAARAVRRLAEDLARDVRVAARSLARTPGYTAAVIAILAVAIGATTAMFSVVHGVLLEPLPYRDPERLVIASVRSPSLEEMSPSYPQVLDWRERNRSFEALGGFRAETYNLTGLDRPERVHAQMFSAGMLKLLGVAPALGREFSAEEDRPGGAPVAMVDHGFWRTRLGGDPAVVGTTLSLDGKPYTIVGVLPEGFRFPGPPSPVVVPVGQMDAQLNQRGVGPGLAGLGRLRAGVTLAQARDDLGAITQASSEQHVEERGDVPTLTPMREQYVKDVRQKLLFLMGAVALVLLIAIANVANLALARGTARQRELAIRAALGAGRGRLVRQLLVEAVLLALAAGALGTLLALWGVELVAAARPDALPTTALIRVDRSVLAFALGASLGSGLLFGVVPALTLSDARLHDALRASASSGGARRRTRAALVLVEVALAFVLLAGAGLTLRALSALERTPLGFDPRNVLTFQVAASPGKYGTPERLRAFQAQVLARLAALPGVKSAALSAFLPLTDEVAEMGVKRREAPRPEPRDIDYAVYYPATPAYHDVLGIALVAGRRFTDADGPRAPHVAIVDEKLAARLFPGQDPLGRWISNVRATTAFQIVGVARHVTAFGLGAKEATPYQLYYPITQLDDAYAVALARDVHVVLKTTVPPLSLVAAARAEVAAVDPDQPVYAVKTMDDFVAGSVEGERFTIALLGGFAGIALLLAALGLYAVMSYAVTRRTHEIGVRMALGAQPSAVQRMVVGDGLRLAAGGLAVGLLGAIAAARVGVSLVSGLRPLDPATYAAAALLLAAVATAAAWLPARRATRVDPTVALREE